MPSLLNHGFRFLNDTLPVHGFDARLPSSCDDRSIWAIIQSCLVTISLCTWTAAHPNITGPNGGTLAGLWARGLITLEALLTPELIIAWSMQQWLVARKSTRDVNDPDRWTMSHAYFLSMGGFVLHVHGEQGKDAIAIEHPLCPDEFLFLLRTAYIDLPNITEREIKDKSKGDIVSKLLTLIQTGWFVTQCIARKFKGLPITELELTTVAFSLTNTATYLFWLKKPLNVECTVAVPLKRPISKEDWDTCMWYIRGPQLAEEKVVPIEKVKDLEDGDESAPRSRVPHDIPTATKEGRGWTVILFEDVRTEITMENDQECERRLTKQKVHVRYSGNLPQWQLVITFLTAGFLAVTFAGIHYAAWTTSFPTEEERILWRVCCLVMTGVPCWLAVTFGLVNLLHKCLYPFRFHIRKSVRAARYVYIVARLGMLVGMFVSLRSLPPAAYQTVQWTTFWPHI